LTYGDKTLSAKIFEIGVLGFEMKDLADSGAGCSKRFFGRPYAIGTPSE
jgi:hypothetical protein